MNSHETARKIFLAGVKGVLPGKLIGDLISLKGSQLKIGYQGYDLDKYNNIYVIGAGKASASMGHYVEIILGKRISDGHIITKYGSYVKLKKIRVTEAGHPVPDHNSFMATEDVLRIADKASENDLVICLFSGGGSSLLTDFPESASHEDMILLNDLLVKCGADIIKINAVRKHLSEIKGGQLARRIAPAEFVTILISDVPGDRIDCIASGPTVPDDSTFVDAVKVLEEYHLQNQVPERLVNYLREGIQGMREETPKPGDTLFARSHTFIAGSNRIALQAAKAEAEKSGYTAFILTDQLFGDPEGACRWFREMIYRYRNDGAIPKPVCLLFGGELTLKVSGNGEGGRNQHLALTAALRLSDIPGFTFLSAGTDGNDGNTDMAGAVVDSETVHNALSENIDPEKYLREFDSYNFFKSAGGHIFTGPTFTNVMDIVVLLIE
ncbi:MAG: glycerate kinase [Bacteroidota bacterium]